MQIPGIEASSVSREAQQVRRNLTSLWWLFCDSAL
jgi:hypothetical protein